MARINAGDVIIQISYPDRPEGPVAVEYRCSRVEIREAPERIPIGHPFEYTDYAPIRTEVTINATLESVPTVVTSNPAIAVAGESMAGSVELPVPTLEDALCAAIKDKDIAAAFALLDDLIEKHERPEGFVERRELLELLKRYEWQGNHETDYTCPECGANSEDSLWGKTHEEGCLLARAIGARHKGQDILPKKGN